MSETSSLTERYTGRVKWFNSKTGFGFVTVTDGSKSGTDVFVHHSTIHVGKEQYRYLVQGEYIQFNLSRMVDGPHEFQACEVSGVNGGPLMCESLLETGRQVRAYRPRQPRSEYTNTRGGTEYETRTSETRTSEYRRPEYQTPREDSRRKVPPVTESRTTSSSGRGRGTTQGRGTGSSSGRGERGRGQQRV